MRPPVERYVRAVLTDGPVETILGIEMRNASEYFDLLAESHDIMLSAIDELAGSLAGANPAVLAGRIEERIVAHWPGRYWFLEVSSSGERDGWIQVFSPPPRPAIPKEAA